MTERDSSARTACFRCRTTGSSPSTTQEGGFVTYLCDDDVWAPEALARVSQVLVSSGSAARGPICGPLLLAELARFQLLRNVAKFALFTGEVREHRSHETIRSSTTPVES